MNIYYSKVGLPKMGLTNQIFSFISAILIGIRDNYHIVIYDDFLDDYNMNNYSDISKIIDIEYMNLYLKQYNIVIASKHDMIDIVKVEYGKNKPQPNYIEVTKIFIDNFYKNNKLYIPKKFNFNKIFGDPYKNVIKEIIITFKLNNTLFTKIISEHNELINIDFNNTHCIFNKNFYWINSINKKLFIDIMKNIKFNDIFYKNIDKITNNKINVIHLRLEDDAIIHWSKMNKMSESDFRKTLENKYIDIIKKYINVNDHNIILSYGFNNVIKFMQDTSMMNYIYSFRNKDMNGRELNAIKDFIYSLQCNNILIHNFNMINMNGSTFSFMLDTCINCNMKISIDLDHINNNYNIYNSNEQ